MNDEGKSTVIVAGRTLANKVVPILVDDTGVISVSGGAGGGGNLATAAKGTTPAGNPTSRSVDANTHALDVFIQGGAGGGGGPAQLQVRNAGDTAWVNVVAGGAVRVPVDGSGVTQPISAISLPLPTGAATETTLAAVNTKLAGTLTVDTEFTLDTHSDVLNPASSPGAAAYTYLRDAGGGTWVRARGDATNGQWVNIKSAVALDVSDRAGRLVGVVYGSQGQQLKQTATNFNAQVEVAVGGTLVDPRAIRALTSADVVTAAQGTAAAASGAWPMKNTDGTNVAAVKAASTAPVAGDPALVVALSPNTPAIGILNQPATSGGWLISRVLSAATTNATSAKGSAGQVGGWFVYNANAAVRYLKIYNKATAPTVGTDTPVMTIPIPPGAAANVEFTNGIQFTTGIGYAITTGVADADTGAVAANEIIVNLFYK